MNRSLLVLAGAVLLAACADETNLLPVYKVARVDVGPAASTLSVGDTMRLTAYPRTPDGVTLGSVPVSWTSESAEVATVETRGFMAVVRASAPGTTRIRAESEGKIGHVTVTVTADPLAGATLLILPDSGTVRVGAELQLEAVLLTADGARIGGRRVTWTSSHPLTATVDTYGNAVFAHARGHAVGDAVISAVSDGVRGEARVRVVPK